MLALNPAISGHAANLAVTGAKMAAGPTQAQGLTKDVQYVTILLGANDICTSSASAMTPTATFTSQFQTTLSAVHNDAPNALVFVSSIPNIYQLWSTLHTNFLAQTVLGGRQDLPVDARALEHEHPAQCRRGPRERAQRRAPNHLYQRRVQRLLQVDNLATYNVKFSSSQVSTLDYFHPNASGQNTLAATTWSASYWGP